MADFSGAVTEARAVRTLQTKYGGASRSDVVRGSWEAPLVEVSPRGCWAGWEPLLSLRLDPSGLFHPSWLAQMVTWPGVSPGA